MPAPLDDKKIGGLSYQQLRKECKERGISAKGKTNLLRNRLREWFRDHDGLCNDDDYEDTANNKRATPTPGSVALPDSKRQKTMTTQIAEELICPITLELPFQPVTAEDGQVYERAAIEEYFNSKMDEDKVKSPITREEIGKRLFPAPKIRNTIEALIENQVITGDAASKWLDKAAEKQEREEMENKAKNGDVNAMEYVAKGYTYGKHGFMVDKKLGFKWYDKARLAGSIRGLTEVGDMVLRGEGVAANERKGVDFLLSAAAEGSDWAAHWLGQAYGRGLHGLPLNTDQAIYWLERALTCEHKILSNSAAAIHEDLDEIRNEQLP